VQASASVVCQLMAGESLYISAASSHSGVRTIQAAFTYSFV